MEWENQCLKLRPRTFQRLLETPAFFSKVMIVPPRISLQSVPWKFDFEAPEASGVPEIESPEPSKDRRERTLCFCCLRPF